MDYDLKCINCGRVYNSKYRNQVCEACGGLLEVIYKGHASRKFFEGVQSFWDFEPLMPKGAYRHFELGMTKLIKSNYNGAFFKLEFENPTGSFKDRGSAIEVAKAKEYGYKYIACASTGNMAYSISYYAKLYGIEASVFISKGANKDKLIDIKSTHDAELHLINGDFTKAQVDAAAYAKRNGAFLAGDYCYRKEGQSTIAYELYMQNPSISNIIIPVGNATLFSALYKAYSTIKKLGIINSIPKLIGVEAKGCAPIYNAITHNSNIKYEKPKTYADAIAVGFPTYGNEAIEAVKRTGGMFITVSDNDMSKEQERFYAGYGIMIELAAASGIAAYAKLRKSLKGSTAIILTGANI